MANWPDVAHGASLYGLQATGEHWKLNSLALLGMAIGGKLGSLLPDPTSANSAGSCNAAAPAGPHAAAAATMMVAIVAVLMPLVGSGSLGAL